MALTGYIGIPISIDIVMAAAIHADHVVTFSPPANGTQLTFVSGGTQTFTSANWNTAQHLVVTPLQSGTIEIPYVVTSAYTTRTVRGTVSVTIATVPVDTWIGVPNTGGDYKLGSESSGTQAVMGVAHIFVTAGAVGSAISVNRTTGTGVSLRIRNPSGTVTLLTGNPASYTPTVGGEHWLYTCVNTQWFTAVSSTLQLKDKTGATNVTITADSSNGTPTSGVVSNDTFHASGSGSHVHTGTVLASTSGGVYVSGCANYGSIVNNANQHMDSITSDAASQTAITATINFTITAGPGGFRVYVVPEITIPDGSGAPTITGAGISNVFTTPNGYYGVVLGPQVYLDSTILVP